MDMVGFLHSRGARFGAGPTWVWRSARLHPIEPLVVSGIFDAWHWQLFDRHEPVKVLVERLRV
jgi:hypothetical protein